MNQALSEKAVNAGRVRGLSQGSAVMGLLSPRIGSEVAVSDRSALPSLPNHCNEM